MRMIDYFRWVKRTWWIVVISALVGGAIAFAYVQVRVPEYTSETTLLAVTPARVPTYVQLASSDEVLESAFAQVGLKRDSADVKVQAETARNSNILTLTVQSSAAGVAHDLGVAVADELVQRAGELEAKIDPERAEPLSVVTETTIEGSDRRTTTIMFLVVGLVAGSGVGVFIASVYDRFWRRIRSEKEIAALTGKSEVARGDISAKSLGVVLGDESKLARRVKELVAAGGASVAVLPFDRHVGVSAAVARELANAVRPEFKSIIVVEAVWDTRPSRRKSSTEAATVGLSDLLVAEARLSDVIIRSETEGFDVIEAGISPVNADKLVASDAFTTLIRELSTIYDLVLVSGSYPNRDPFSGKLQTVTAGSTVGVCLLGKTKRGMASLVRNAQGESVDGFLVLKRTSRK